MILIFISILLLILILGESVDKNISTFSKQSFFENGRYHKLPTVSIESEFIVTNNDTVWILDFPQDIAENSPDIYFVLTVNATYAFHTFSLGDTDKNSRPVRGKFVVHTSKRYVNGDDIFNVSSFKFQSKWWYSWSYIAIRKNINFEFRSDIFPFFGISFRSFLNSQTKTFIIETSASMSDELKEYFRSVQNKIENKTCDAYFLMEQSIEPTSGTSLNGLSCVLSNGQSGNALPRPCYADIVTTNYAFQGKNCWMTKESCGQNNSCILKQLLRSRTYMSHTSCVVCKASEINTSHKKDISSTPIFMSISEPKQRQIQEIFYTEEEIKASSMIQMQPFKKYQSVGSTIEITCKFDPAYVARSMRFGVKHKNNDSINFLPAVEKERDTATYDALTYFITLDSLDIEAIVCFAAVRGHYHWINASRSISVNDFSSPKFITDSEYYTTIEENNVVTIERILMAGSEKVFISCNATGFPPPRMSWKRNSILLESTQEGIFPSLIRRSTLFFNQIDKTTEGVYICQAKNSQGEAKLAYKIIVPDTSVAIFIVSIIVPIIVIFLVLLVIIGLIWKRRRKLITMIFLSDHEEQEFINGSNEKCIRGPNASILKQPFDPKYILLKSSLKFDAKQILGTGQFGVVMNGWICKEEAAVLHVAVKTTKETTDVLHFKALLSEIKISSDLTGHPNIVEFFGACVENIKYGKVYAAYELCQQGDLLTILWRRSAQIKYYDSKIGHDSLKTEVFNDEERTKRHENLLEWSQNIANGMTFLASKNVIHGDLAARNILIAANSVAKISDFGLTRQLLNDHTIYLKKTPDSLPWKWMAPESLTNSNFSVQSDVWSFGIVLWEIFTLGDPLFPGQRYGDKFLKDISEGMRPIKPQLASEDMYNIMIRCWEKCPENRPSIASILMDIQKLIGGVQEESETQYAEL